MKIVIAGSRDFPLSKFSDDGTIESIIAKSPFAGLITEIVCGGARGPDTWGEYWAKDNQIPVKYYPPDWALHGKAAGMIRNKQMADYGDGLIALWDQKSRGTKNMIDNMKKQDKPVFIYPGDGLFKLLYI